MHDFTPINLKDRLAQVPDLWSPRIVAQLNDYHLKLARVQGEFIWHSHPETDELFLVIQGELMIHFRDGEVTLREGELYVVPRGVEHKPAAAEECHLLLVEPAGTVNTGDAAGEHPATAGEWIEPAGLT